MGKIKTSIMIDSDVWKCSKFKLPLKRGLKGISQAVEEALEEELSEKTVAQTLSNMCTKKTADIQIKPVKPKIPTSAGKIIREMRAKVT